MCCEAVRIPVRGLRTVLWVGCDFRNDERDPTAGAA
jgi:hypothetical protein